MTLALMEKANVLPNAEIITQAKTLEANGVGKFDALHATYCLCHGLPSRCVRHNRRPANQKHAENPNPTHHASR